MPFKNEFEMPNFKQSNQGMALLRDVLQAQLQETYVNNQPQVITATQEDIGIPEEDEDLTQFKADPMTMPLSTEARQARQLALLGTTTEQETYKKMQAEYQANVEANTITPEEVDAMDFLDRIAAVESRGSGDYKATNGSMTGRYQFDWGQWGPHIMRETGVKSRDEFLNNPKAQDDFMGGWYDKEVLNKEAADLYEPFKTVYPDADMETLKMAIHQAGSTNIRKGIKEGNLKSWTDGNGVGIDEYLRRSKQAKPSGHVLFNEGVDADISPKLSSKLTELSKALGIPIHLKSGHRDSKRNAAVGGAKNSAHTRHEAGDLDLDRMGIKTKEQKLALLQKASDLGFQGLGVYNAGIHLDTDESLGVRAWGPNYHSNSIPEWAKPVIDKHVNRN